MKESLEKLCIHIICFIFAATVALALGLTIVAVWFGSESLSVLRMADSNSQNWHAGGFWGLVFLAIWSWVLVHLMSSR